MTTTDAKARAQALITKSIYEDATIISEWNSEIASALRETCIGYRDIKRDDGVLIETGIWGEYQDGRKWYIRLSAS